VLPPCEVHHAPSLGSYVVEVEDNDVVLTAVNARVGREIAHQELEVAALAWSSFARCPSSWVAAPGAGSTPGSPPMAVDAHQLAGSDLSGDRIDGVAVRDEVSDFGALGPDVIELEHDRVGKAAVPTRGCVEKIQDVGAGGIASPLSRLIGLPAVQGTSVTHVRVAALPTPRLAPSGGSVKCRDGKVTVAPTAMRRPIPLPGLEGDGDGPGL